MLRVFFANHDDGTHRTSVVDSSGGVEVDVVIGRSYCKGNEKGRRGARVRLSLSLHRHTRSRDKSRCSGTQRAVGVLPDPTEVLTNRKFVLHEIRLLSATFVRPFLRPTYSLPWVYRIRIQYVPPTHATMSFFPFRFKVCSKE